MMKARDLKNSILQLAVEGKLVPQDPNDEPASMLLERIREQKRQLIAEGKAKFPKGGESVIFIGSDGLPYEKRVDAKGSESEPVCIADEVPFEVPEGWCWARLGAVSDVQLGKMLDKQKNQGEPSPYLGNANVRWGSFDLSEVKEMRMTATDQNKFRLQQGDLIVCEGGVPGRCAIWSSVEPMYYQKALHRVRPGSGIEVRYLELYLNYVVGSHLWDSDFTGTTIKHLPAQTLSRWFVPLPPLAEQRRIVAKVDELMPLVEEYGALEDERERLDSSLPDALRKSILQEAVEGRLVPQDPADEPASALLVRIRDERRKMVADGKLRPPKGGESVIFAGSDGRRYEKRVDAKGRESEPVCIEDEIPFEVPESWGWARLGTLATFTGGGTPDKGNPAYWNGGIPWASMKDIHGNILNETIDSITEEGLASKPSISICQPGQLIVSTRLVPGKAIVSNIKCAINQDLKVVNTSLPIEYLSIWFASHLTEFKRTGSGTTVPGIKLSDLESALVPLPPIAEQHRIANKVNELLGLITSQ